MCCRDMWIINPLAPAVWSGLLNWQEYGTRFFPGCTPDVDCGFLIFRVGIRHTRQHQEIRYRWVPFDALDRGEVDENRKWSKQFQRPNPNGCWHVVTSCGD